MKRDEDKSNREEKRGREVDENDTMKEMEKKDGREPWGAITKRREWDRYGKREREKETTASRWLLWGQLFATIWDSHIREKPQTQQIGCSSNELHVDHDLPFGNSEAAIVAHKLARGGVTC